MQGINCVKGEIHNVLTVLRLNPPRDIPTSSSAAAASSTAGSQSQSHSQSSSYSHFYSSDSNYDSSLIRQLKDLYELLSLHASLASIDTVAFVSPFLAVISTDSTDLFTTAAALHSVHKFLVYGLVAHCTAARALILTVHTLTHCRLDAGAYDRQDAEVVQMKVIEVCMECLRSASGDGLNDESVVAMVEHCMAVRRQRDASKVMRRYAENALMQMVLLLFARIGEEGAGGDRARPADVIREPRASRRNKRRSISVRKENSITEEDSEDADSDPVRRMSSASPDSDHESSSSLGHVPRLSTTPPPLARALSSSSSASSSSSSASSAPYGVSALQRVFVLLIDLINPASSASSSRSSSSHSSFSSPQQEADAIFGLRLIRTVLETAGPRLAAYPTLVDCVQDALCKYLLAVSQTRDLFILSLVLRIVFDLFSTVKQHLRVQLEVFFVSIHLRIADSAGSSFQQKELVMESIVEFCKEPSLIVGLYRNYDCFPETETRVLTDAGFLFLDEIEARRAAGDTVLYACYEAAKSKPAKNEDVLRGRLVYCKGELVMPYEVSADGRRPTRTPPTELLQFCSSNEAKRWIADSGPYGVGLVQQQEDEENEEDKDEEEEEEESADMRSRSLSLCVTPTHLMYVQQGRWQKSGKQAHYNQHARVDTAPKPVIASSLPTTDIKSATRMLACASAGLLPTPTEAQAAFVRSVRTSLRLRDDAQFLAFLELFGFWLGDGTLVYPASGASGGVRFAQVNPDDITFIDGVLPKIGVSARQVQRSVTQLKRADGTPKVVVMWDIVNSDWFDFFNKEFGAKYSRSGKYDSKEALLKQGTPRRPSITSTASASASATASVSPASSMRARSSSVSAGVSVSASSSSICGGASLWCPDCGNDDLVQEDDGSWYCFECCQPVPAWESVPAGQPVPSLSDTAMKDEPMKEEEDVPAVTFHEDEPMKEEPEEKKTKPPPPSDTIDLTEEPPTDDIDDPDYPIKSVKWLPPWVLLCLTRDESFCVLQGLWRADGRWGGKRRHKVIFTSGVLFRDQLMQLLFHCGCSPCPRLGYKAGTARGYNWHDQKVDKTVYTVRFWKKLSTEKQALYTPITATVDGWRVEWADTLSTAGKGSCWISLRNQEAITRVPYSHAQHGRIWCVDVKHNEHLIVAQRAVRTNGVVTKQSRPVVVGNCEVGSTDLFTDLCKFLTTVGTGQAAGGRLSSLALEAMVAVLQSIAKRFCSSDLYTSSAAAPPPPSASSPTAAAYDSEDEESQLVMNPEEESALLHSKQHKQKLLLAAQHFNKEGKAAFPYLQSLALLAAPVTADSVVHFFRSTPGLNRQRIGEYLGGHEPMQLAVLQRFVETFSFEHVKGRAGVSETASGGGEGAGSGVVGIDDALRAFLDCFLLPGESQQIGRIIEKFSEAYYRACPGPLLSADAAYVLAYSVIMLNTDAHNSQVSRKMTKEEFIKNLRGINEGKDLPADYLSQLYDSIKSHEIKMTSDSIRDLDGSDGGSLSSRRWQSVLGKQSGLFQTSAPRIHGRDMFNLVWQSAVSMFAAYLENAQLHTLGGSSSAPEHKLLQKVQQGVFAFARICSVYALHDCFNSLVIQLARSLALFLHDCLHDPTYSPAASFGRDRRAQMVCVTLFRLVEEYGEVGLLEGWTNVLHCLLWLRVIDVLPDSVMEMEDFRDAKGGPLPSLKRDRSPVRPNAADSAGDGYSKLSYLVSFFLADDDTPRPSASTSAADGQWAAEGKQVISSCKLDSLFASSKYFRPASLLCLLRGLLLVSSYATQPSSNMSIFSPLTLGEDAAVLCLELLAGVIEKNQQRLADPSLKLWQTLYDHLYSAVTHAPPEPTFYIERLVVNILRFSVRLFHGSDPASASHCIQLLSLLLALSQSAMRRLGSRVVAGLQIFIQTRGDGLRDNKSWEVLGRLLLAYRADSDHSVATAAFSTWLLGVDNYVSVESFGLFLALLYQWMGQGDADGKKQTHRVPSRLVLDAALRLHARLASPAFEKELAGLSEGTVREKARVDLWLSSVQQFCLACKDHRADVRRHAMDCLQNVLLASDSVQMNNPLAWRICFEKLLLPLLDSVARFPPTAASQSNQSHDSDRSHSVPSSGPAYDIGLKASSLLFQVFLHHLDTLLLSGDFPVFWLRLLASIHKHTHSAAGGGGSGEGRAAVHFIESLKNVLLVLQAAGAWDTVQQRSGQDLWGLTMQSIDLFKPDWRQELKECMGERIGLREVRGAPQLPAALSVDSRSVSAASEELNGDITVAAFLHQQPSAAAALESRPTAPPTHGTKYPPNRPPFSAHGTSYLPQAHVAHSTAQPADAPPTRTLPIVALPPSTPLTPTSAQSPAVTFHSVQPQPTASASPPAAYPVSLPPALSTPIRAALSASAASSTSAPFSVPAAATFSSASFHPIPPPVGVVPLRSALQHPPPPPPAAFHFRPVPPPAGAALLPPAAVPSTAALNGRAPIVFSTAPSASAVPLSTPAPPLPRLSAPPAGPLNGHAATAHTAAPVVIRFPVRAVLSPTSASAHAQQQPTASVSQPAAGAAAVPVVPRLYAPPAGAARYANGAAVGAVPRMPTVVSSNGLKGMPARPAGMRPVPPGAGSE